MIGADVSDKLLVLKIKNENCEESLAELIKRHSGLCVKICQKYAAAFEKKGFDSQDIFEEKDFIIYRAAMLYKNSEGRNMKVSSWIGTYARYYCLTKLNKGSNFIPLQDNWKSNQIISPLENYTTDYIFDVLASLKDQRIYKIFKLRYFNINGKKKTSFKKIAEELNVSSQTCVNLHSRALKLLKRKIISKEIFDKI